MNNSTATKPHLPAECAPCGIYCGACPSFEISCRGCSAASPEQKRTSWQGCRIRQCCFSTHAFTTCAECDQFPCTLIHKKLINPHPEDPRYAYRREVTQNMAQFRQRGLADYLHYQQEKWRCPMCGGHMLFYAYRCRQCGYQAPNTIQINKPD